MPILKPPSLLLKSAEAELNGFGGTMQRFPAEHYRDQRMRFSAWIKTQDVPSGVQLFLRVDRPSARGSLRFDNMATCNRPRPLQP